MPLKNKKTYNVLICNILILSATFLFSTLFSGCLPKKNTPSTPPIAMTPIMGSTSPQPNACVKIYYDRSPTRGYTTGYSHALLLKNLINHFYLGYQFITPIEEYRAGDLLTCPYNFYLGSYYNNILPTAFLMESMNPTTHIVWMGYNIWQLGTLFSNHFGYQFSGLSKFNPFVRDNTGAPSFFSSIIYKDIIFKKDSQERPLNPANLPYEMSILQPVFNPPLSQSLAIAKNPWSNEFFPYAIKRNNKYYLAEVPLAYIYESQQYLVLADLLFDIFNYAPTHIHPLVGISIATDDLEALNPLTLAFISRLNEFNLPYFMTLNPQSKRLKVKKSTVGENTLSFMRNSQGLLWDLTLTQKSKDILDFLSNIKKQQSQLIKLGVTPLAPITSQSDRSLQENFVLGQLFPIKIGLTEVYNFVSSPQSSATPSINAPQAPFTFPIPESRWNSLELRAPKLMDSFHQSPLTPYIIQSDLFSQRVIPLLTTLGENADVNKVTDKIRVLSVIRDSTHFINIDNSAFQTQQDLENALHIIKYYKTLNYEFINKSFFK